MSPGVILFVVLLGAMWFLLVRPQRRRQLEQRRQWETAAPGDEIVTAGGLYGTITRTVDESDVMLEIAPGVEVRVARRAIAGIFTHDQADDEPDEADELEPAADAEEEPAAPEPAREPRG
jgi:preprotein translocase subunit YajC